MLGKSTRPGFSTVTPYLMVESVDPVVDFMARAFDAKETTRVRGDAGGFHVEVQIGDSILMLGGDSDASEPTPCALFLYVEDVDAVYQSALQAGAESIIEPADGMFNEQRGAGVVDPFGNQWYFGRH